MPITLSQYKTKIKSVITAVKTDIIAPIAGSSAISTRYITAESLEDTDWIAYLRNDAGVVDIFLIDLSALIGLRAEEKGFVGGFDKPVDIYVDYFLDYRIGIESSNSQDTFLDKVLALDFYLETHETITDNIYIQSYDIRTSLKVFTSGTCHRAQVVLNLLVTGNQLQ